MVGYFSDAIAILCMWLCEKCLLKSLYGLKLRKFILDCIDNISRKRWCAEDKDDDMVSRIKSDLKLMACLYQD